MNRLKLLSLTALLALAGCDLIEKKKLYGFESSNKFYHLTDLETFKKLQDL